jgi:hypothetical protein
MTGSGMRAPCAALGVGLDDGREVGAAVGEQVVDAAFGEPAEVGPGGGVRLEGEIQVFFHGFLLSN